ncbi:unnamed protein product [Linum tenue]|uniref:Uncharacterized protein n=1 Tax=Linum tenue TaxID=586396 RepID=A0AAV0RAJ2_9ROSI|nr:unnamed protein product [Linum tenue]
MSAETDEAVEVTVEGSDTEPVVEEEAVAGDATEEQQRRETQVLERAIRATDVAAVEEGDFVTPAAVQIRTVPVVPSIDRIGDESLDSHTSSTRTRPGLEDYAADYDLGLFWDFLQESNWKFRKKKMVEEGLQREERRNRERPLISKVFGEENSPLLWVKLDEGRTDLSASHRQCGEETTANCRASSSASQTAAALTHSLAARVVAMTADEKKQEGGDDFPSSFRTSSDEVAEIRGGGSDCPPSRLTTLSREKEAKRAPSGREASRKEPRTTDAEAESEKRPAARESPCRLGRSRRRRVACVPLGRETTREGGCYLSPATLVRLTQKQQVGRAVLQFVGRSVRIYGFDGPARRVLSHGLDLTLGMMLIRPCPLFNDEETEAEIALTSEKFGLVPRVYVVCEADEIYKPDLQRWMIENNPTDDVKPISSADHMAMFSKPHELCTYLLELASKYT